MYPEDLVVAALALRIGRPVKWVATRIEDLLGTQHARDQVDSAEAAVDAEGRVLALRSAPLPTSAPTCARKQRPTDADRRLRDGPYRIEALEVETISVFTNTTPTGAYRGAGRPESTYLVERIMDQAARRLGIDSAEFRRRNLIQTDQFPYYTPSGTPFDSGDYPSLLDTALSLPTTRR